MTIDELTQRRLRNNIREKARNTTLIAFSEHAVKRAEERGITPKDVARILINGDFCDEIIANEKQNEYKFKFAYHIKEQNICAVGIIQMDLKGRIYLITVYHITNNTDE